MFTLPDTDTDTVKKLVIKNCVEVFTLPGTDTDTDAIGLQTRFVGVGIEQCEHFFPVTQFEIYRKPMKLREGNVFSRICVSVHRRGTMSPLSMIHWASQYRDSPPTHTQDMGPRYTASLPRLIPYQIHMVAKTGNLFKLVHLSTQW